MTPSGSESYLTQTASGRRFDLASGQSWTIGRGDGCLVQLDSRSVSRLHALIQRLDTGDFQLVDLGSRNGSFLNSRRVTLPIVLKDTDRLVFGDQELEFRNLAQPASAAATVSSDTRNAMTTAMTSTKVASILVVDIRDYTPLANSITEALLSQTVGTWFLRTGDIVQRLGSWAQKYIGDAVMAVWLHDDPSQTRREILSVLQAAAEIEAATAEISRSLPLPNPIRIGAGINTGPAIVGSGDVIGEPVNMAFRLETATKAAGTNMLVGEATFRELKMTDAAPFERREVPLKGYVSPRPAWAISFDDLRRFVTSTPR